MYIQKYRERIVAIFFLSFLSFHVLSFYFDVVKQEQLVNKGLSVGYELCLLGY